MGLTLIFILMQGLYLAKYMEDKPTAEDEEKG